MAIFLIIFAMIFLGAGIYFLFLVSKPHPQHQPNLPKRITAFTNPDPNANIVSNKFTRIKTESYTATARSSLEAVQVITALHSEYEKAVIADQTFDARLKRDLLTLDNQNEITERATALGVPVLDYSRFMLEVLKSKTEITKEAISLRMSIDLAIATSDRHFALIKQLQGQIRSLRLELHQLPQRQLPEPVQELETADLKSQITSLEARLNDHLKQTGVSETDGQTA